MNREWDWDKFEKSGSVRDYLLYRSKLKRDEKDAVEITRQGVSYEDNRRWDSYSRDGFRRK